MEEKDNTTTSDKIIAISAKKIGEVAAACENNTIIIYSDTNFTPKNTIRVQQKITCLDYSSQAPNALLGYGTSNGTVFLCNTSNNSITQVGNIQKASIEAISFDDSGKKIAAASLDGTIAIYSRNSPNDSNWTSSKFQGCTLGCTAVAWGTPHTLLKTLTLFVGGVDGVIRVFTSSEESNLDWKMVASAEIFSTFVKKIAFPSTSVNAFNQKIGICSQNGEVAVARYSDMKLHCQKIEIGKAATSIAWTMGEKTLVISFPDGTTSYIEDNELFQ